MTNLYAVTFTSLDGNEMTVEVEAYSSGKAQDVFEANYEFDQNEIVIIKLVSNRRGF